jgi:hypothetical protein
VIFGATSEDDARSGFLAALPATLNGFPLSEDECEVDEVNGLDNIYTGSAVWSSTAQNQTADSFSISIDISTITQTLKHSIATIDKKCKTGVTPIDYYGAIGVTGYGKDRTVEGVEILIPTMNYQVKYTFDAGDVDNEFFGKIYRTIGKTNDDAFGPFAECELLFVACNGALRDKTLWDVNYSFAASPNKTGIVIGDLEAIDKKGWEYLWVINSLSPDGTNKTLLPKPVQVNVEKVYEDADYTELGINIDLEV